MKTWLERWALLSLWGLLAVALVVVLLTLQRALPGPPVIEYLNSPVVLEKSDVCPGDVVSYPVQQVIRKPVVLAIVAVILRENGDTVVLDRTPVYTAVPSARGITDRDILWTVPDLEPGRYERVVSAATMGTDHEPAFLRVPFTIREDCP